MREATKAMSAGSPLKAKTLSRRFVPRVIPGGGLPLRLKAVLCAEILAVYVSVRWRMPRADVREVVLSIRDRPVVQPAGLQAASLEAKQAAARLGIAVDRTLRVLPTDSRCLAQSLVLSWLLSAREISSTLVIGARSDPDFEAHAWVEHFGQPVLSPLGFSEFRLLEI